MDGRMLDATRRSGLRKCVHESPTNPETRSRSVRGGWPPAVTNAASVRAAKTVLFLRQAAFLVHEPPHIFETAEARTHKAAVSGHYLPDRVVRHRSEEAFARCPARSSQPCSQRKLQ